MTARNGELLREARRQGWQVERRCGSSHLLLRHPEAAQAAQAAQAVVVASTPGDRRSRLNARAQLRRALRRPAPAVRSPRAGTDCGTCGP